MQGGGKNAWLPFPTREGETVTLVWLESSEIETNIGLLETKATAKRTA